MPGQALVTELRALGAEAEFVRADVRLEDDVRNLVGKSVERFGCLHSEPQSSVDQTPA
jgi:NAD(P)-dependent dehydrogenase (short-subunit alcohol dehydrogenase family)